jgi:hypothetical protein
LTDEPAEDDASRRARHAEARRLARQAVAKSKRSTGVQFAPHFVRDDAQQAAPPLARMLRGGRGGAVRLKLYLTMTLIAVRAPHEIKPLNGRAWAELLDLPDPAGNGARRVADALTVLQTMRLIEVTRRAGHAPDVQLRSSDGRGKRYSWQGKRYISLPLHFWEEGWIHRLSGTAVALLLVLLDLQGGRSSSDPPYLIGSQRGRYALSDDTWTRATAELVREGLLTVSRVPQGQDFDYRRLRNTYWLSTAGLATPPAEAAELDGGKPLSPSKGA